MRDLRDLEDLEEEIKNSNQQNASVSALAPVGRNRLAAAAASLVVCAYAVGMVLPVDQLWLETYVQASLYPAALAQRAKEDGPHPAPPVVPSDKTATPGAPNKSKAEKDKKSGQDKKTEPAKIDKAASERLFKEAMDERKKEHYPTSTQKLQEALAADPTNEKVKKEIAFNYFKLGMNIQGFTDVKINFIKKAIEYDPSKQEYKDTLKKLSAANETANPKPSNK
ncbi:MAG: hypothetical protein J0M35_19070 [Candidatus Obscuribacter phosphatis]|uniref:Tetratricopeptide repeat protein n=1 Tax=Candidatus Obscuribacter phosphatis TaxID=1906157 RepID=A0A8J7P9X2_9BACT|nr:hypothetical protein [Candidatus Obscuribacter phosphatis]